jgi:hypothetical protein
MIRCDLDLFHPYHLGKSIILQILEFGVSYGDTLIRVTNYVGWTSSIITSDTEASTEPCQLDLDSFRFC